MAIQDFYYSNTLAAFTALLEPGSGRENEQGMRTPEHLAWMVTQVAKLDRTSIEDAIKAARWIGWMLCAAEELGFWDNARSRALIRKDIAEGYALPSVRTRV